MTLLDKSSGALKPNFKGYLKRPLQGKDIVGVIGVVDDVLGVVLVMVVVIDTVVVECVCKA